MDPAYAVSVVIPAYNYARFLPQAIDSILAQDYPLVECIVVDDGSKDDTRAVVAAYGTKVRYIYQTNAGLPAARNTGIRAAQHPFIALLDADDWFAPTMLSEVMAAFQQLPPDYGVVAVDLIHADATGRVQTRKSMPAASQQIVSCADLLVKTRFCACAAVSRKSALQACGLFDETLTSTEDRDMWLRVAARYRIRVLPQALVYIRDHATSMSKKADRMRDNMLRVLHKSYALRLVPHSRWWIWARAFSYNYFHIAWMYHDEGRRGPALQYLLRSWLYWPCYLQPQRYNDPLLFRLRALRTFLRGLPPAPASSPPAASAPPAPG